MLKIEPTLKKDDDNDMLLINEGSDYILYDNSKVYVSTTGSLPLSVEEAENLIKGLTEAIKLAKEKKC